VPSSPGTTQSSPRASPSAPADRIKVHGFACFRAIVRLLRSRCDRPKEVTMRRTILEAIVFRNRSGSPEPRAALGG
jgi:hypothetical protein